MSICERIRLILKREKISDKTVAAWLGLTPQRLSQKFRDNIWDSLRELEIIAEKTGYRFEWIHLGEGSEKYDGVRSNGGEVNEAVEHYITGKALRPVTVTVEKSGKENIVLIPVHSYSAYLKGCADPNFMKTLTGYSLPNFSDNNHRMFQVGGNSMLQLNGGLADGDIVIGQYINNISSSIQDNKVYVIVGKDGIYIKRCLNRLHKEEKTLVLTSDNKKGDYPPIILRADAIVEAWEVKALINSQVNSNSDLSEVINELQTQQALLKDKIQKLENSKS